MRQLITFHMSQKTTMHGKSIDVADKKQEEKGGLRVILLFRRMFITCTSLAPFHFTHAKIHKEQPHSTY